MPNNPDNECADCKKVFKEDGTIKAESLQFGIYYNGLPICKNCANIRYENHITKIERNTDSPLIKALNVIEKL